VIVAVAAPGGASAALTRLADSLAGTGPMFAQLAAFALVAIALGAGARAAMLWMDVHRAARLAARATRPPVVPAATVAAAPAGGRAAPVATVADPAIASAAPAAGPPPRSQHAGAPALAPHRSAALLRAFTRHIRPARPGHGRRHTPQSVRQLAESGAARPEIARRTGLSQDAVGLALHLGGRRN
jgi:hypothetical protein